MLLAGKELLTVQVILIMSPGLYLACRPLTAGLEEGDTKIYIMYKILGSNV